ncbi:MAG: DUF3536 domain-containing protein [Candidatus Anammoxibacter sp.]
MNKYICIHSHFYQPPRENPWLEKVERQESAYPYHDWNERITAECYLPNAKSPILGENGENIKNINNYEKIDFNFGPTLLSWIQRRKPEVYKTIINADHDARKKFSGHGSAIAQIYNHLIMPLANDRDKQTQVIWGIADFVYHFGRNPEGIWLSETAVDLKTLEAIAEHGIKFTILAPRQAKRVRKISNDTWIDVTNEKIDTKKPYLCQLPSGKSINIFFFDGAISHGLAFGNLLNNGEDFAKRLLAAFANNGEQAQLVNIATDGETFGHHQRYGNMALAYCTHYIESNNLAKVTIYGEYLEKFPPDYEVEIVEDSSWSCVHGIERWRSDCGCHAGSFPEWSQEWRAPLREAMDWLRGRLGQIYEESVSGLIDNPWNARNDYIDIIVDRSNAKLEDFLLNHTVKELSKKEKLKVLQLLEMQKHSMFMYTSCGWFFDDVSRIETVQIMQCAARSIQLAKEVSGIDLEPEYIKFLSRAPSNVSDFKSADMVYDMLVRPTIPENADLKLQERFVELGN